MATIYQFHFFFVLSHITHIACWISREKLVFSNICLFPVIISCIWMSPNIKFQDGHQRRPYWKFNSKENSPGNRYIITFPINHSTQSPFLASFMYFDRSECQNLRWSPSVISIDFRFKPFDPLILLNVTSATRFKQYLLIQHGILNNNMIYQYPNRTRCSCTQMCMAIWHKSSHNAGTILALRSR